MVGAMGPFVVEYAQLLFRWLHLVAGVMWVGNLWFFNFVNAQLAKTYDAETKKKVVPELMPRVLYFFRYAAIYTWVTGFLLLGIVYYGGGVLLPSEGARFHNGPTAGIGFLSLLFAWVVYDLLWKSIPDETIAAVISFALIVAYAFGMGRLVSGRAMVIHVGAAFGTIMVCNVWMRIWPAQKKILRGVTGKGPAPEASVAAMAGLRSKHNTYLSMPLLLAMVVASHFPGVYGSDYAWAFVALFVLLGWALAKWLYVKSASPAVTAIE